VLLDVRCLRFSEVPGLEVVVDGRGEVGPWTQNCRVGGEGRRGLNGVDRDCTFVCTSMSNTYVPVRFIRMIPINHWLYVCIPMRGIDGQLRDHQEFRSLRKAPKINLVEVNSK
jgi:hypothetical protein